MAIISMKALLESGVHFGHRTNNWDPKMKPYIFTERNGIHIIDLQQTVKALNEVYDLIRRTVADGGKVLFVGTKRQAKETIAEEASRCNMPYVNERWLGGTITNWTTILQRIFELERLEKMRDSGEIDRLTKKEGLMIEREINRLLTRLSGLRMTRQLPDLLFVIDVGREYTAVHEANLKGIPVIAMVDTNCDPRGVDYVIPSNDDAIRAIKLLVGKVADAVIEGNMMRKDIEEEMPVTAVPARGGEFTHSLIDSDDDLEENLLGEATLAKLESARIKRIPETSPASASETLVDESTEDNPVEETSPGEEAEAVESMKEAAEAEDDSGEEEATAEETISGEEVEPVDTVKKTAAVEADAGEEEETAEESET